MEYRPGQGCGWTRYKPGVSIAQLRWPPSLEGSRVTLDCQLLCKGNCRSQFSDADLNKYSSVMENPSSLSVSERREFMNKFPDGEEQNKSLSEALTCHYCRQTESSDLGKQIKTFLETSTPWEMPKPKYDQSFIGTTGLIELKDGEALYWFRNPKGNFGFVEWSSGERLYLRKTDSNK
jgi:hypothetical protein